MIQRIEEELVPKLVEALYSEFMTEALAPGLKRDSSILPSKPSQLSLHPRVPMVQRDLMGSGFAEPGFEVGLGVPLSSRQGRTAKMPGP